jgi:succinoglycan biosynthesis protein ExoV
MATGRNFGDDLNRHLWSDLARVGILPLPKEPTLLVGIGSLIGMGELRGVPRVVCCGAGAGYHLPMEYTWGRWFPYHYPVCEPRPYSLSAHWDIRAVRGPLTAQVVGRTDLPKFDPAVILPRIYQRRASSKTEFGFMPHHLLSEDGYEAASRDLREAARRMPVLSNDPSMAGVQDAMEACVRQLWS